MNQPCTVQGCPQERKRHSAIYCQAHDEEFRADWVGPDAVTELDALETALRQVVRQEMEKNGWLDW